MVDISGRTLGLISGLLLTTALLTGCLASTSRPLQLLFGSGPMYPPAAREDGVEGFVVVRYDVAVDGRVTSGRVVRSQPAGVFDAAALATVRSWIFHPALVDGEPQREQGRESTVTFKIDGGDEYADY